MDEEKFYKKYIKMYEYNSIYLKSLSSFMEQSKWAKACSPMLQQQSLMERSYLPVFEAVQRNSLLMNKIMEHQSVWTKTIEHFNQYNTLSQIVNGYDFNLISSNIEIISKFINTPSVISALDKQRTMFDKLASYNEEDSETLSPESLIEIIEESEIEQHLQIIDEDDSNSEMKEYLIKNHLAIIAILLPIIFFILSNTAQTKQNKEFLSKLNEIQTEQVIENKQNIQDHDLLKSMNDNLIEETHLLKIIVQQNKEEKTNNKKKK